MTFLTNEVITAVLLNNMNFSLFNSFAISRGYVFVLVNIHSFSLIFQYSKVVQSQISPLVN